MMSTVLDSHDLGCTEEDMVNYLFLLPILYVVERLYTIFLMEDGSTASSFAARFIELNPLSKSTEVKKEENDVELMKASHMHVVFA